MKKKLPKLIKHLQNEKKKHTTKQNKAAKKETDKIGKQTFLTPTHAYLGDIS